MSKPYGRESDKMTFTPDLPTQDELNITLFELVEINFEDLPASSRESSSCTEGGYPVDKPELYCFEDYHPLKNEPRSCSPVNEKENIYFNKDPVDDDDAKRELHRSKTLPIIRPTKLVPHENDTTTPTSATSLAPPGPPQRKVSAPNVSVQKRIKTSPEPRYAGQKLHPRSQSCERQRRRSCGFLGGRSPIRGSAWNFDDDTDSTTSSETMTTVSDDVSLQSAHKIPTQLYYTTPPKANMVRSPDDRRNARRSSNFRHEGTKANGRQRSVSLDYGDGRMMTMFTSESETLPRSKQTLHPSPSDPGVLLRNNGHPSPGRPPRTPSSTPKKRGSVSSTDTDGSSPGKFDRKRLSKDVRSYDIIALFDAVEHQDLDAVKEILVTNGVDINSVNSEFLTPLDVAVMTNNIPMAKMLLSNGARESPLFQREETRSARLDVLVSEAERRVVDLTAAVLNGSSGSNTVSTNQQKENERQLSHWEFRHRLLKRMKAGYDHARCPDPPTNVSLNIASSSSLLVKFGEPLNRNGAVVTKYKVEWSKHESFMPLEGSAVLDDVRNLEMEIRNLEKGTPIYIRVAAMNMKGYSQFANSNPLYGVPSRYLKTGGREGVRANLLNPLWIRHCYRWSIDGFPFKEEGALTLSDFIAGWRDIDQTMPRSEGKLKILEELFTQVKQLRPADASVIKDKPGTTSPVQRKKKGFKNLFSSAPKFHKSFKRGVYLACFFYCEDKVLVTSEDQLPIVEVDETFAGPSINLDLYWLMKVACTWDDIKSLRQDMDKSTAEGKVHFRGKLLQAISIMQTALGTHDLGQFYYKPLKDPSGSTILVSVNFVMDPKVMTFGKWIPISKLQRRQSASMPELSEAQDCLVTSFHEMTQYNQTSELSLPPGLYLGYLKLHVSVDLIRVLVSQNAPNVLPNVRVRDVSNVSSEEWEWMKVIGSDNPVVPPSNNQQNFQNSLAKAAKKLFKHLGISESFASAHRLYDVEVIELSPHVSFLLILPPVEDVCIIPGQSDTVIEREDLVLLPVQVFEMIHLCTYQTKFISRYSRLSSILEMDIILAQQMQREAFSKEELNIAKERVQQLCNLQQDLDKAWKGMRWIMDIITYARARTLKGGIPISSLLTPAGESSLTSELEQKGKILDNNNSQGCGSVACDSNEISVGKDNRKIAKFYDPTEEEGQENGHVKSKNNPSSHSDNSGILRVYAAYETGLAKGTSVKLHVTPKTTAREVINLVVQNLNQAVLNKGKTGPVYDEEQFSDFCLVAVIGARERILRDSYQPLQLQNPWTKGRLYVRMRNNLLAAIQQGHATTV